MKKFLIILFMSLITGSSYYGLVTKKQEQSKDFQNTVQETVQENVVQNEISEEIQENAVSEVENIVEPEEITQNTTKKQDEKTENKTTNKKSTVQEPQQQNITSKTTTNTKQTEQNTKSNTQATPSTKSNENTKTVDLSKYAYYEKASDGSYKAFLVDKSEINKLKGLIDNAINSFGYKNIRVVEDSSLSRDGTMYFTANTTNVENAVYDSEGFNIYYYAVKEYWISPNGTEKYFQTRSYVKVK